MSRKNKKRDREGRHGKEVQQQTPSSSDRKVTDKPSLVKEDMKSSIAHTTSTLNISKTVLATNLETDEKTNLSVVSRKRKLTRIDFVKPNVNGQSEDFSFIEEKRRLESSAVAIKFEDGHTTTSARTGRQKLDASSHSKSHKTKELGNNVVREEQYNGDQGAVAENKQPTMSQNSHHVRIATKTASTDVHDEESTTAGRHRCNLSGISVEDAVRDRRGLRPRSNSTDGELKLPQRGLCDEHHVLEKFKWKFEMRSVPAGFNNLGNTCFLNSTLQCLAYLPPFCQALLEMNEDVMKSKIQNSDNGSRTNQGKRITRILRSLFLRVHGRNDDVKNMTSLSPSALVGALPTLGASGSRSGYRFRPGRQEDAHEFLVHLLDAMHVGELLEAGINPHRSGWRDRLPVARLDETTFVHRIFGGYFRSQVRCTNCSYRSNTYDPFLDLSLEISKGSCGSIISAFKEFSRKETLDAQNRWKCSGCKKRVCATKQLTVFRPPLSLCIQLKRFSFRGNTHSMGGFSRFNHFGGGTKISKSIDFPARFELPLSDGRSCWYSLSGIVIHVGNSASSGHYTAYVKRPGKNSHQWFYMDDSDATSVSESTALRQKDAYLLFYCREEVKLEFPSPPQKTMSASEAQEFSRKRARTRSESFTDYVPATGAAAKSQQSISVLKDEKYDLTLNVTSHQKEKIKSDAANHEVGNAKSPPKAKLASQPQDCKAQTAKESDTPCVAIDASAMADASRREIADRNQHPTKSKTAETNEESVLKREGSPNTKDEHPLLSKEVISFSRSNSQAIPNTTKESESAALVAKTDLSSDISSNGISKRIEPSLLAPGLGINENVVDSLNETQKKENTLCDSKLLEKTEGISVESPKLRVLSKKSKKETTISLNRDGGKVQVVMRPLKSTHKNVWNPSTIGETKSDTYGLLGNVAVSKWDDPVDDDSPNMEAVKPSERERDKMINELDEKERLRKRRSHSDRWDSSLDQGKKKKVKKKSDVRKSSDSGLNPFQRIQNSLQRMDLARRKPHLPRKNKGKR